MERWWLWTLLLFIGVEILILVFGSHTGFLKTFFISIFRYLQRRKFNIVSSLQRTTSLQRLARAEQEFQRWRNNYPDSPWSDAIPQHLIQQIISALTFAYSTNAISSEMFTEKMNFYGAEINNSNSPTH